MLKNYLTIAFRNLRKHSGFTLINVFGLGLGIMASLLIGLYARHELTYDRFHEKADRIHLVYKERLTPTGMQRTEDTWAPLSEALQDDYPAVVDGVRLMDNPEWVQYGEHRFQEQVTYADASLFDVFDVPLVRGDPTTALVDINNVVISEDIAERFFGDTDPIGKTLTVDHTYSFTVTGILAPLPSNSTLDIDLAVRWESIDSYDDFKDNWGGSFLFTYILLAPDAEAAALEAQFPAFITKIWDAEVAERTNFRLEPLSELHNARTGNRRYAYILVGIALAILLIACINFTNLATARSMERVREIGMRKVMGAHRPQLIGQFLGEAIFLSLMALALALALTQLLIPAFNEFYDLRLSLTLLHPATWLLVLGLGLLVGCLAGLYPALYLSGLRPISTLRGASNKGPSGLRLRQGLIVTQFAVSIALIACTLLVRNQINYMKNADLKLDRENLVALSVEPGDFADAEAAQQQLNAFTEALAQESRVVSVTSSAHRPGEWAGWFTFARPQDWGDRDPLRLRVAYMDEHYFDTYGIELVAGEGFDPERPADMETAIIINEVAVRDFGWTLGEAVGKTVGRGNTDFTVIGVVADYHFDSLQNEVAPVLHNYRPTEHNVHNYITVRLTPGDTQEALAMMEGHWATVDRSRPMPYEFVDETYAALYEQEDRMAAAAGAFTLLAVLVACLGLLGLAAFAAQQRTKEIGVRKVLGASVTRIVLLLTKEFSWLVLVGFALAVPLAYFAIDEWMTAFPYRAAISVWPFVWAGLLAFIVAVLTISSQSIRAALADPVESLRYE